MATSAATLAAYEPEFELEVGPHAAGDLLVIGFEGEEEISRPFTLEVNTVVHPEADVDAGALVGAKAALTIHLGHGSDRFLHGVVAKVQAWEEGGDENRRRVKLRIVPQLWKLAQRRNSRIFQSKTIPDIVKEVLDAGEVKHREKLSGTHAVREYLVQYAE